jgi:hypothetical protein
MEKEGERERKRKKKEREREKKRKMREDGGWKGGRVRIKREKRRINDFFGIGKKDPARA